MTTLLTALALSALAAKPTPVAGKAAITLEAVEALPSVEASALPVAADAAQAPLPQGGGAPGAFQSLQAVSARAPDAAPEPGRLDALFEGARPAEDDRAALAAASFLQPPETYPYAHGFLAGVREPDAARGRFIAKLGMPTTEELSAAWARRHDSLRGRWQWLRNVDPQWKLPREHALLLGVFYHESSLEPVAMAVKLIYRDKAGELAASAEAVYRDLRAPVSGLGEALTDLFIGEIYPAIGVRYETIKADYLGRLVWALTGAYEFLPQKGTPARANFFDLDGRAVSTTALMRANLARLLARQKPRMALRELRLPGAPDKPVTWDDLNTPRDFVSLTHKDGRTISVPVRYGAEGALTEPRALPVGRAFALADYRPAPGEPAVNGKMRMRKKFSPTAMPIWNGIARVSK